MPDISRRAGFHNTQTYSVGAYETEGERHQDTVAGTAEEVALPMLAIVTSLGGAEMAIHCALSTALNAWPSQPTQPPTQAAGSSSVPTQLKQTAASSLPGQMSMRPALQVRQILTNKCPG